MPRTIRRAPPRAAIRFLRVRLALDGRPDTIQWTPASTSVIGS